MIPRQEAELAWGSKVIFPPLLCHFLLFVAAFHWNVRAQKINEVRVEWLPYQPKLNKSFTQTSAAWKEQTWALDTMVSTTNYHPILHPCTRPPPPFLLSTGLLLPLRRVSNESLEGIYKATGRFKTRVALLTLQKINVSSPPTWLHKHICPDRQAWSIMRKKWFCKLFLWQQCGQWESVVDNKLLICRGILWVRTCVCENMQRHGQQTISEPNHSCNRS